MAGPSPRVDASTLDRLRAYSVHLLTASGVVFAFAAVAALLAPGPDARLVFLLLLAPAVIDAIDGPLARRWQVARWAPAIQGRTLDDIVDYLNWTFVPLLLVWRMEWVPAPRAAYVVVAMAASLFGFANRRAKQEEAGFFRGFPSYWNVFAFYAGLWATRYGPALPGSVCLLLAALTVLPVRFLYPNLSPAPWRLPLLLGAAAWVAMLSAMLPSYPHPPAALVWASLAYPAFYVAASAWLGRRASRAGLP